MVDLEKAKKDALRSLYPKKSFEEVNADFVPTPEVKKDDFTKMGGPITRSGEFDYSADPLMEKVLLDAKKDLHRSKLNALRSMGSTESEDHFYERIGVVKKKQTRNDMTGDKKIEEIDRKLEILSKQRDDFNNYLLIDDKKSRELVEKRVYDFVFEDYVKELKALDEEYKYVE